MPAPRVVGLGDVVRKIGALVAFVVHAFPKVGHKPNCRLTSAK